MDADHPIMRHVYIGMAALAGAVTSLSTMQWKTMSWPEIVMTIFVGATFSIYAVPVAISSFWKVDPGNLQLVCGITYVGATVSNTCIPLLGKWATSWIKAKEGGEA